MIPSFSDIENYFTILGGIILAIIIIRMGWFTVEYVFHKGDDQHRYHVKFSMQDETTSLLYLMILWAILTWLVGAFGS